MDEEQKPREPPFMSELVPDLRPTRKQVQSGVRTTIVVVVVLLAVLLLLYVVGLLFGVTLWNVLKVLALPITVGAAVPLLNWLQKKRELEISERRAESDREGAEQRAQDDALQAYLDQMSQLLADKDRPLHRAAPGDNLSTLARARTLTVLTRLSGKRKRSILQFVSEAGLIKGQQPVVSLEGADLRGAHLSGANWSKANLNKTYLSNAELSEADLSGADLSFAYLYKANLIYANLSGANLSGADLICVALDHANLSGANLSGAKLAPPLGSFVIQEHQLPGTLKRKPDDEEPLGIDELEGVGTRVTMSNFELFGANLTRADLTGANLRGAEGDIYGRLMAMAESREGATMPNGQKYEDWLGTLEGQHWLRENAGLIRAEKERKGGYEDWMKTTEGKMWLKAVGEDEENPNPS